MTLHECWARMLLSVKGMSAEKVAFVIAEGGGYETPKRLWEAFRRDEERERREMGLGLGVEFYEAPRAQQLTGESKK